MPLDFPSGPTNGLVYGSYVYDSSLPGWRSKGGAVAATYVSDTAPSGAVKGDMWYRSSDGTTYVYVVDVDTSQWVEIRSEISTTRVGLIPVAPTSLTVTSGTATVAANGLITFTGVSGLYVDGIFTSTYKNYRYLLRLKQGGSGSTGVNTVMRSGGTSRTSGYYWGGYISYVSGTLQAYTANNSNSFLSGFANTSSTSSGVVDVFYPAITSELTTFHTQSLGSDGSTFALNNTGYQSTAEVQDGIGFYATAGTWSGTLQVYGYN